MYNLWIYYLSIAIGVMVLLSVLQIDAKNIQVSNGKQYSRCELIQELQRAFDMPADKAATWTCLAINGKKSKAENPLGRKDVLIKDIYACKSAQVVKPCFQSCYELKQLNDIDYMDCMKKVYDSEREATGDGFNGWPTYESSCRGKIEQYSEGCSGALEPTPSKLPLEDVSAFNHKIYKPCELAHELLDVHHVPLEEVGIWVCLAGRANYNASLIGPLAEDGRNRDFGLWQIFSEWWCGLDGPGGICGIECSKLADNEITDDLKCAQLIVRETMAKSGDGFTAWPIYTTRCKANATDYISECGFGTIPPRVIETPTPTTPRTETITLPSGGIAFEACDMARELLKNNVPMDELDTWMCIIERESNFNTSAISIEHPDGSHERGLFRVSDNYWCSPLGKGKKCNIECDKLMDADVTDDIECARKIIEIEGFAAWGSYNQYCVSDKKPYVEDCSLGGSSNSNSPDLSQGKVFSVCELAHELSSKHTIPAKDVNTWLCIMENESNFSTASISEPNSDGSREHGILKISDNYWCSTTDSGKACELSCDKLHDASLTDDIACAKKIYDREGFNAWRTYNTECRRNTPDYLKECDPSGGNIAIEAITTAKPIEPKAKGKVYEVCELALELRYKHRIPPSQINNWVCIVENESRFNTSDVREGNGIKSYGLFHISDQWWCGVDKECHVDCANLEDSDIADDVQCAKRIFIIEQSKSNNGFNAWTSYEKNMCQERDPSYTGRCFEGLDENGKRI